MHNGGAAPRREGYAHDGVLADYVSEADLARELGVGWRTLFRWRTQTHEAPPFIRVSRRIFYHREAVREWLANRQVEAA
jgi:hypothetical protein